MIGCDKSKMLNLTNSRKRNSSQMDAAKSYGSKESNHSQEEIREQKAQLAEQKHFRENVDQNPCEVAASKLESHPLNQERINDICEVGKGDQKQTHPFESKQQAETFQHKSHEDIQSDAFQLINELRSDYEAFCQKMALEMAGLQRSWEKREKRLWEELKNVKGELEEKMTLNKVHLTELGLSDKNDLSLISGSQDEGTSTKENKGPKKPDNQSVTSLALPQFRGVSAPMDVDETCKNFEVIETLNVPQVSFELPLASVPQLQEQSLQMCHPAPAAWEGQGIQPATPLVSIQYQTPNILQISNRVPFGCARLTLPQNIPPVSIKDQDPNILQTLNPVSFGCEGLTLPQNIPSVSIKDQDPSILQTLNPISFGCEGLTLPQNIPPVSVKAQDPNILQTLNPISFGCEGLTLPQNIPPVCVKAQDPNILQTLNPVSFGCEGLAIQQEIRSVSYLSQDPNIIEMSNPGPFGCEGQAMQQETRLVSFLCQGTEILEIPNPVTFGCEGWAMQKETHSVSLYQDPNILQMSNPVTFGCEQQAILQENQSVSLPYQEPNILQMSYPVPLRYEGRAMMQQMNTVFSPNEEPNNLQMSHLAAHCGCEGQAIKQETSLVSSICQGVLQKRVEKADRPNVPPSSELRDPTPIDVAEIRGKCGMMITS